MKMLLDRRLRGFTNIMVRANGDQVVWFAEKLAHRTDLKRRWRLGRSAKSRS
jgi:hypothetical protein